MWTVLLVEDEVFVRETIVELIEWEKYGFTVIGEAGNGEEALEFIKQNEPNLVITDILMPIMNGIDLLKKAKESGINSLFVMLSCLNDFEYVRQAMEYGASNYILKLSMRVQTLRETLEKINIELIKKNGSYTKEMDLQYDNLWDLIKYNQKITVTDKGIIEPLLIFRNFKLMIFSILHGSSSFSEKDFFDIGIIDFDQESVVHIYTRAGQSSVFFWTNKKLSVNKDRLENSEYCVVCSDLVSVYEIGATWQKNLRKIDSIWRNKNLENQFERFDQNIQWQFEKGILVAFEQLDRERLVAMLENMWELVEEKGITMALSKDIATRLNQVISNFIEKPQDANDYNHFLSHCNFKNNVTLGLLDYFNQRVNEVGLLSDHPEINKVLKYIHQNYNKKLTVKSLAKRVAMDENYLSTLFKKETSETLINYIHKFRIEKAKKVLIETNLTITQISEKVGFFNDNYFIKIFKRLTSYTPKSYRESHSKYSKICNIEK